MKILHIETATQVCSVALSNNGVLVLAKAIDEANVHASRLTLLISELLADAGIGLKDLSAIAVSKGPGSYTGLRIGVATAKGLCYGADLPLLAIDSLHLMAAGFVGSYREAKEKNDRSKLLFCPMIDARRMEVYSAVYDESLHQVEPIAARIIDQAAFFEKYENNKLLLFGDGADKLYPLFAAGTAVEVVRGFKSSAAYGVYLAFEQLKAGNYEDIAYFEPYYLKDFVPTLPKVKNRS